MVGPTVDLLLGFSIGTLLGSKVEACSKLGFGSERLVGPADGKSLFVNIELSSETVDAMGASDSASLGFGVGG